MKFVNRKRDTESIEYSDDSLVFSMTSYTHEKHKCDEEQSVFMSLSLSQADLMRRCHKDSRPQTD